MSTLAPAVAPRAYASERVLLVDPARELLSDHKLESLPALLEAGDLVVLNDAATLPAALPLTSHPGELRLAAHEPDGSFLAIVLGAGTSKQPTEARVAAPRLTPGERVTAGALSATITAVDAAEPRLVSVRFDVSGRELIVGLYACGHPVSYAYLAKAPELWDVTSRFAARPWAFEPASAGLPLTFKLLGELRQRGVELRALTHAAGLSSTGSLSLDRRLPLPERYDIPAELVGAVTETRARGGRVIAIGTTVVRALESCVLEYGELRAGTGVARLAIGPHFRPRVVDGVLTGMHESKTSHFELLSAFAPSALLERALEFAAARGYVQHEFGDTTLVLPSSRAVARAA